MLLDKIRTCRKIIRASQESGIKKKEIISQAKHANEIFEISIDDFCSYKLWNMSDTRIARVFLNNQRRTNLKTKKRKKIEKATGKSQSTIKKEIRKIKTDYSIELSMNHYFSYSFYKYDCFNKQEIAPVIEKYNELIESGELLTEKILDIDAGKKKYTDIKEEIEKYYKLTEELISDAEIKRSFKKLKKCINNLKRDDTKTREIAVDMLVSKELLGFTPGEYISYHFFEKNIEEKREFINSKEREIAIKLLNTNDAMDTLDNKYLAYTKLKKYYGRELMLITGSKDYPDFEKFCKGKTSFVKKNNFDSLGRGVEKIDIDELTDYKRLFEGLRNEGFGPTLLEELIKPSALIRNLNPDSVNTIRVIVYIQDGKPQIQYTFMKVGRAGSFVDNGGAGGIIIHINKDTGIFDSNGIDENGIIYEKHPDHGYKFIGIKLPDWSNLIDKACEAALQIEGLGYVGWDFTYTADNEWIIIEGNSSTQFIAQQGTINTGVKKSFYDSIDYWNRIEEQGNI